jgi:signal transduction histidine kinase
MSRQPRADRKIREKSQKYEPVTPAPQTDSTVDAPGTDSQLRADKLAALAEFAAAAGHEINNPLATILICTQRLLAGITDPEQRRLLATIGGQALRVRDMIGDVMLFARPPAPRPESLDLSAVAREVVDRLQDQFAAAHIKVRLDVSATVQVWADPTQLRVVISELLRNAIEAQPDGGRIEIACRPTGEVSPGFSMLRIADLGPGLDAKSREHLFDPFFSGRQAGRGLGFGLSKAWRIVTLHGGRIEAFEPHAGGVQMDVYWPTDCELKE